MAPPTTTASNRSGGGMDSNQRTRPLVTARSGSASSSGSTFNRTRPVTLRRETPSTLTTRPKLASQGSSTASTSSSSAQPLISLLSSIPKPSFPPTEAFDQLPLDEALVHSRLLQLARHYMHQSDCNVESASSDLQSASLYARLALQTDSASLPARRLLAATLLHGAQPFPFGPSSIHSCPLSLTSNGTSPLSSASISGAHAAIELLKDGPEDVFLDVGCARIFAQACTILGRTREGKEAMAWTLKRVAERKRSKSSSSSSSNAEVDNLIGMTPNLNSKAVEEASVYNDLGTLASRGNRYEEAISNFLNAKKIDPWSWTAWVGLCDLGCDGDVSSMFSGEVCKPSFFYAAQLESQLSNHNYDKEAIRRTIEELKTIGDDYFLTSPANVNAGKDEEGTIDYSIPKTTSTNSVSALRKPIGSTAATNPSANSTSSLSRVGAGTRDDGAASTTSGTKRVRTTTAGSSNGGAMPRLAPGVGQNGRSKGVSGNATTDVHASKRPAITAFRGRGLSSQSTTTTTTSVRTGGTLAAVRTNEQQRPTSSASGSSRGASEKETLKPRRSARVNVAVIDEQQQPSNNPKSGINRSTGTTMTGQVRRPVARTHDSAHSMTEAEGGSNRKAASTRSGEPTASNKVLVNIMQTAAFESARQASIWNTVDRGVKQLLQTLGMAYFAVKNFQSKSALILLRRKRPISSAEKAELKRELGWDLPVSSLIGLDDFYRNSVDVQCLMARAHHDMSRYHLAEKHFLHARRLSPCLDMHMDIFSLTLFHLQREVPLSRLARELSHLDINSAVSHIAKGNAFALQREHSLALQSFQRACLAAPNCAYAFTLAGYEAFELGLKEKSVRYFRQAINLERRHWNAFAGLGRVYFESEKYSSAEYYYRRAIAIHKTNPVLWDVYGSVLSAQGKLNEAETAFERAIQQDASFAMSHIKLAEVLLVQGQSLYENQEKAHRHLLEAVKYAPEEAHVHLMLAHTFMAKGRGSFARIDQGGKKRRVSSDEGTAMQILLPSELQQVGANGLSGPSSTARAIGNSTIPNEYQAEIAKHLCAAIDLDPRYVRYVKAMGEGAKAALRGIVSRFMMDGNGGGDGSTLLMDSSAVMEGQTVDSIVDLDGDQVLEDATALTEDLDSEEEEEREEELEGEEEQEDDETGALEGSASEGELMEDDEEEDDDEAREDLADVENDAEPRSGARHAMDQSDVSMSF